MATPIDDRDHVLYRFFGARGTLLYIGITMNLPTRTGDHRDGKPWWLSVASMTVEHFPDRASALEAERRAIRSERPLYNVQHNESSPQPSGTAARGGRARVAPSSPLTPICMACRVAIPPGDNGVIHIVERTAYAAASRAREVEDRRTHARVEAELRGDFTRVMATYEMAMEEPAPIEWMVHCDSCNPHERDGVWCGGCYWFSVDRCKTWAQLIEWTCHLSEKDWLAATNWMDWIRRIAHGSVEVGLVAQSTDTYGAAGC